MGLLASDCNYSEVSVDEHDSDSTPSVHKGPPCVPIHTEPYPCRCIRIKGDPCDKEKSENRNLMLRFLHLISIFSPFHCHKHYFAFAWCSFGIRV